MINSKITDWSHDLCNLRVHVYMCTWYGGGGALGGCILGGGCIPVYNK